MNQAECYHARLILDMILTSTVALLAHSTNLKLSCARRYGAQTLVRRVISCFIVSRFNIITVKTDQVRMSEYISI